MTVEVEGAQDSHTEVVPSREWQGGVGAGKIGESVPRKGSAFK